MYFNARSLLPKMDELRALSIVHRPHLICIVETWLNETILNTELSIDDYDIVRLDRNRQGGGVMIFVANALTYKLVISGPNDTELIVLSILNFSLSPLTIGLFYRPPSSPVSIFDTLLNSLCMHIDVTLLSNFVLLGDFNVNYLVPHGPLFQSIHHLAASLCLTQVVHEPTRFSVNTCSLIDLIFMSAPTNLLKCITISLHPLTVHSLCNL